MRQVIHKWITNLDADTECHDMIYLEDKLHRNATMSWKKTTCKKCLKKKSKVK